MHQNCFGRAQDYGIDESIAQAGLEAFQEAMGLAEDDLVRARVEKASICAYRAAIEPIAKLAQEKSELDPALAEKMRPLVKKFFELCRKYGVTHVAEGTTVDAAYQSAKDIFGLAPGEEL